MDPLLLLKAAILGLVEGATEFLPISSTGHLILVGDWLGFTGERANAFTVFIQLGAILAVVWLYRQKVASVVTNAHRDPAARRLIVSIVVAFIPAAVVGLLLESWIDEHLFRPLTVAFALVVGGVAILVIERWHPRPPRVVEADNIDRRSALGVGLAQVLALFPGVSRSGATIMGGMALGLSRVAATEFSFFLAIPVMFAATLFKLFKERDILSVADVPVFAVGFVVSFVSAVVVIKALLRFVSRHTFVGFAWYRIVFGIALLLFYWNR